MNSEKKLLLNRLKRIEGQIRGLQKMVEDDKYCIDVITQTQAVKSSISSFEDSLLEGHLSHCVVDQIKNNQSDKAIEEMMKVFKVTKKK